MKTLKEKRRRAGARWIDHHGGTGEGGIPRYKESKEALRREVALFPTESTGLLSVSMKFCILKRVGAPVQGIEAPCATKWRSFPGESTGLLSVSMKFCILKRVGAPV